ncbi:MAG: ABC transporter substrate-binding protein, partial [Trebonia sp.]
MNRKIAFSVVAAALALGTAACGAAGSSGSAGSGGTATGKPLTIVTTALSPMTDNFNPFMKTGTGYEVHAVDLYDMPLMIFNTQDASQQPIPELATGYKWSADGRTLTITTRSGVKWSDGTPFSASD